MKIIKLINELSQFNPNADVSLIDSDDICLSWIADDGEGSGKKETMKVFIEGTDYCPRCAHEDDGYCYFYQKDCSDVKKCCQFEEYDKELTKQINLDEFKR